MAKWKSLEDIVNANVYDLALPEGYETPSFWGAAKKYTVSASVKADATEGQFNYAKLSNPKKARKLADSLCSKFGKTSLIGTLGKLLGCYEVKEKDGNVAAVYDLGKNSVLDLYQRKITYIADKEGNVNIAYKCDEATPERVIRNDLQKLYKALKARPSYFVRNPAKAANPNPTPAETKADAENPADAYNSWLKQGAEKGYVNILAEKLRATAGAPAPRYAPKLGKVRNIADMQNPIYNINDNKIGA